MSNEQLVSEKSAPQVHLGEKTLSIIVPVYNEQKFIIKILQKLADLELKVNKEIVVVNDGSTDNTLALLKEFSKNNDIVLIDLTINQGKGGALKNGIAASKGDFVIVQDADFEYDPNEIPKLLDAMVETGYRVVYGSRFKGPDASRGYFINLLGNKALTLATNIVLGSRLTDMETGYKLFDGTLLRSFEISSKGFDFEPEITCKVSKSNVKIHEIPISYNPRNYDAGKKIRFRDGVYALIAIFKYGVLGKK